MFARMSSNRIPSSTESGNDACLMGVNSLIANSVYDAGGNHVGTLEELVVDTRTGCIRHAVLAIGGFMGIGRKRVAVPWSALSPDADFCRCVVDVAHMQLTAVRVPDDDPWLQRNDSTRAAENDSLRARLLRPRLIQGL